MPPGQNTTYSIQARFDGIEAVLSGMSRIALAAGNTGQRIERSARNARREWERMDSTFSRLHRGIERLSTAKTEIGAIWRRGTEGLRRYTDESIRLSQAQEKFKSLGLGQQQNERAFRAVKDTVDNLKGLRLDKTTEMVTDLNTVFGDLGHAMEALPLAGKFRFGMEALFGEDIGKDRMDDMIQNGFKFLEVIGKIRATGPVDPKTGLAEFLQRDREEMERFFNTLVKGSVATGGRVTMADMLQMARTGKTSVKGLSEEGLQTLMTLIPERGAPQTGSSMMSLYQNLIAGRMNISGLNRLAQLGLLDMSKVELNKARNKVTKMLPGAVKHSELLMEDPLKFADEFAKVLAVRGGAQGKGIDVGDVRQVSQEIATILRERTAQDLLVTLITQRNAILKERGNILKAEGVEDLYQRGLESPTGKLQQFDNAMANLRAEVGGPLVTALTDAAVAARPLLKIFEAYPMATLLAIGIVKIGSAALQTAASLRMAGLWPSGRNAASPAPLSSLGARQQWDALFAQQGAPSAGRFTNIGKRVGSLIGAGLGLGLAAWGIEAIISSISRRAEVEAAAREAGAEIASIMRGGLEADLSKMPEEARHQFFRQKAMTEAGQLGEAKVRQLSMKEGPAASGESQIAMALLAAVRPSEYATSAPSALNEMAQKRGAWSFAGMGEETQKQYATEFVDNLLRQLQIKSDIELATFLAKGREALEKGGAGEAIPLFEERLKAVYPELFNSYEKQINQQKQLMEQYGYAGDKVRFLGDQAEKAAAKIGKESPDTGTPEPPVKKARGGIVMRPTRALVGEAGPEWITPFHQTIAALRGGDRRVSLSAPVTINVSGPVEPNQMQSIRRASESGVRRGGAAVLQMLEYQFMDAEARS